MDYLHTLVGIKYTYYNENENKLPSREIDESPFWIGNGKMPKITELREHGMCCVGLINLLRRYLNLSIPSYDNNRIVTGGTGAWFKYLNSEKRLNPIDYNKKYKPGTLFIQDYNKEDQGHVAIVYDSSIETTIIHAQGVGKKQEVMIENLSESCNGYRYTHYCDDFIDV